MVITVLDQKYKCGCNRGINAIEKDFILIHLNSIIEWKFCTFPQRLKEGAEPDEEGKYKDEDIYEDREFLGADPELKPGDCFLYSGQVIAVDSENRLILIVSETGPKALNRIWEEAIEPEFDMMFGNYLVNRVDYKQINPTLIPTNYEGVQSVPYPIVKIWDEHFIQGRFQQEKELSVELNVDSDEILWPITIYATRTKGTWLFRYNEEDIVADNEDDVKRVILSIVSWFYQHKPRKEYIDKDKLRQEAQEKAMEEMQALMAAQQGQQP